MAGTTLQAVGATVNIIVTMTKPALFAAGSNLFHRFVVACGTLKTFVCAFKIKARLAIVIKMPVCPVHRVMTLRTATAEQALMLVFVGVTVLALRRCAGKLLVGVAGFTTYRRMLAQ